jgi:hypothetical protein
VKLGGRLRTGAYEHGYKEEIEENEEEGNAWAQSQASRKKGEGPHEDRSKEVCRFEADTETSARQGRFGRAG